LSTDMFACSTVRPNRKAATRTDGFQHASPEGKA
jgi:hypothetical protein